MADADTVPIPKWFLRAVVGAMGAGLVAAACWAHSVGQDIAAIRVELRAANELRSTELADVRRRLDRIEAALDGKVK
jgi:hypothetical protein